MRVFCEIDLASLCTMDGCIDTLLTEIQSCEKHWHKSLPSRLAVTSRLLSSVFSVLLDST